MTELKPCPFCGERGIAHRVPTGWRVSCTRCDCQPRPGFPPDTEAEAIAAWNTRAVPRATGDDGELVERLREFGPTAKTTTDQNLMDQAADRITALTAENERLREEKDRLVTFVNNLIEDVGLEYDGMRLQ